MMKEKSETVKVVVRCRPLSSGEIHDQHECVIEVDGKNGVISLQNPTTREPKNFTFDHTYDWNSSQQQIFEETALPILKSVMEGYNGTIFAYGQTGTGKTYTMEGNDNECDKGINPRSIEWIFNNIKNYTNQQFLVRASFVEIYNEECRDLLSKVPRQKLNVREKEKVFYLEDVSIFQAENAQRMMDIMKAGRVNRATGATKMNPGSSRSHSIFSIIVEASSLDAQGETHYRVGKLNLVDLAGSERQSKTESTGERFKEATKINLSLTILGSVINKLVSGKTQYIPYRDSKLTMLLQDSLGGNTKTVMIANVGPADYNYDETINTLWYASHAKKIKNKPRINEDPKDALLRQYQEEIEAMKKQLFALGKGDLVSKISGGKPGMSIMDEENQVRVALENLEKERTQFKKEHEDEIRRIKKEKNIEEEKKKKIIDQLNKEIEEADKAKAERKKLMEEYKRKKKEIQKGEETEKKVKELESELIKNKEDLEIKKREEDRLREELEEKKRQNIELNEKYQSQKEQIDDLNKKINQVRKNIENQRRENKENEDRMQKEKENYDEMIKSLQINNKKLEFIIEKFIPQEERERIEKILEYNEEKKKYSMNKKRGILNNYKLNMEKLKEMRKTQMNINPKMTTFKQDLINLKLEMPDNFCEDEFDEDTVKQIDKEIDHILKDDDSDLLYYDQQISMITPSLTPEILNISSRKMESKSTTEGNGENKKGSSYKPQIKK